MSFDYKMAWKEWAVPSYRSLPRNVRHLVIRTVRDSEFRVQNPDLMVEWPENDLRVAFYEIPSEILAVAARVVYFFGHWGNRKCFQQTGGYWKFSNYCDQVLKNKLELLYHHGDGMNLEVFEGLFRVRIDTPYMSTFREIDIATQTNKEKLEKYFVQPRGMRSRKDWDEYFDFAEAKLKRIKENHKVASPTIRKYFETIKRAS